MADQRDIGFYRTPVQIEVFADRTEIQHAGMDEPLVLKSGDKFRVYMSFEAWAEGYIDGVGWESDRA